jgi:Dolichyl-phosphate-mannose-protein mannosyltransferase
VSRRPLLLLTLLALALRIGFLLAEPRVNPAGDEPVWIVLGIKGVLKLKHPFSPLEMPNIFYPPAYPYFIAAMRAAGGANRAALWGQTLLGALLVPAVGLIAGRLSSRAGLTAAVLTAVYPELLWYSAHFWSETLFLCFLWWAFERLLTARATGRVGPAVASGLLMGLASLTRETALWFIPVAALWLLWGRMQAGRTAALAFALTALLTIAPWTLRNWVAYHGFVPVATAGALNLWEGNTRLARNEVYAVADSVASPMDQYRLSWSNAMKAIAERQPLWFFEKLRSEMPLFWGAESEAAMHLERGAYGTDVRPATAVLVRRLLAIPYLLVLGLALVGLVTLVLDREWWLLLGFAVYYNLLHVVSHAMDRYRMPILPLLFLLAGVGVSALRDGERRRGVAHHRLRAILASGFWLLVSYWSLR